MSAFGTHYDRDDIAGEVLIGTLRRLNEERKNKSNPSKLTEKQLREAIRLGTEMAEEEALFKLAMKAKQVAELKRRQPRLVWDRDRGIIGAN